MFYFLGSLCEISKGTPITVNKVLGTYSTANECAQACKSKKSCLIWHFDRKSDECRIVKLKSKYFNKQKINSIIITRVGSI